MDILGTRRTRGLGDSGTRGLASFHTDRNFQNYFFTKILIVQIYYSTNVLLKKVQGDTKLIVANLTKISVSIATFFNCYILLRNTYIVLILNLDCICKYFFTIFIMKTYQVFLGTNKPSGGIVSTQEWLTFLKQIDAVFQGYTVETASGSWQGIKEKTYILTVITDEIKQLIRIAEDYKMIFNQDSVLIQELPVKPLFV